MLYSVLRLIINRSQIHFYFLLICLGFSFGCEEEIPVAQNRGVRISKQRSNPSQDLRKYTQTGSGPTQAPEWVSGQDLNMMRLFSHQEITGFRNGHPFKPKRIFLQRGEQGWTLILNEKDVRFAQDLLYRGQRIEIPLSQDPSEELKQTAQFGESRAVWRLPTKLKGKTQKWESKNAYVLEFLEWNPGHYNSKGSVVQSTGEVTGRLMVHFKDDEGVEGWISGRFEKIQVRYLGNPQLWSTQK